MSENPPKDVSTKSSSGGILTIIGTILQIIMQVFKRKGDKTKFEKEKKRLEEEKYKEAIDNDDFFNRYN